MGERVTSDIPTLPFPTRYRTSKSMPGSGAMPYWPSPKRRNADTLGVIARQEILNRLPLLALIVENRNLGKRARRAGGSRGEETRGRCGVDQGRGGGRSGCARVVQSQGQAGIAGDGADLIRRLGGI